MDTIKLNLINRSNDANNSEIVIFQKNGVTEADNFAVAWKVIPNHQVGSNGYSFAYSTGIKIAAVDPWGNSTDQFHAAPGMAFRLSGESPMFTMQPEEEPTANAEEVALTNASNQDGVVVHCYRDGMLCAVSGQVAPDQKAVFQLAPKIWIGVAQEVAEGEIIKDAIISQVNTELSLSGILEADIIMTGGGSGADAKPYEFHLENVINS